jgi:dihydroorotase
LDAISKITSQSAAILGITGGNLSIGSDADITIFDPEQVWTVTPNQLVSQGKNTPFLGIEMMGKVQYTLLHGQITYQANL